MSELASALGKVHVEWSPEREKRVARSLVKRRKRQVRVRAATGVLAVLCLGLGGALLLRPDPYPLQLADGIRALRVSKDASIDVATPEPGLVTAVLHGSARFNVAHRKDRKFRLQAGEVTIEDLGTRFTVEQLQSSVRVSVEEGAVAIRAPRLITTLKAPQSLEIAQAAEPPPEEPPATAFTPRKPHHKRAAPTKDKMWKALAEDGDYDAAWDALSKTGPSTVKDETEELLLAVDVARLSHHPADAVSPLNRILAHHRTDPRAPLAAFTLGRVLLEDLGSPRDAAGAFANAQTLDPNGPLAEDALAREVESWSRAGEGSRARERAEEYLAKYPDGRRVRSVTRFGHVE